MLDVYRMVGFQWGSGNARKRPDKHSVHQIEAERTFSNQPLSRTET